MARFFLDEVFGFFADLLFGRLERTSAGEEGRTSPIG